MTYNNKIPMSDLLILHDESEHEITNIAFDYYAPYSNAPKSVAAEFHQALKLNIALGELLLESMAEEVAFPTLQAIGDQAFPVANCTIPFLKESTRIQETMAESHDTMVEVERKFRFLAPTRRIGI